jgi:hypothetical protein
MSRSQCRENFKSHANLFNDKMRMFEQSVEQNVDKYGEESN